MTAILLGNHRRLRRAALSEVAPGPTGAAGGARLWLPDSGTCPADRRERPPRRHRHRPAAGGAVQAQAARLCPRPRAGGGRGEAGRGDLRRGELFLPSSRGPRRAEMCGGRRAAWRRSRQAARQSSSTTMRRLAWQPLRGFYRRLFDRFEPFAESMWHHEVREFSGNADAFCWEKVTMFGGIFQKTVARRPSSIATCVAGQPRPDRADAHRKPE